MNLNLHTINGETIAFITLFGENRHNAVTDAHYHVMMEHFGLPVNYIKCPFPAVSHGYMMNVVLEQTVDIPEAPDYYWWIDNDCIALRREAFGLAYRQVMDKITLWGHLWLSNHKLGPNGTKWHCYPSQACLMFPRQMYLDLGKPNMDHWIPRSDTSEEMAYIAKAAGYNISLLYPSHSVLADTPGDNGIFYGIGNVYGPLKRPLWHHTSAAPHPRHVEIFTETCKMVLADRFEGPNPAAPYA